MLFESSLLLVQMWTQTPDLAALHCVPHVASGASGMGLTPIGWKSSELCSLPVPR
jgi:hypothetical protein